MPCGRRSCCVQGVSNRPGIPDGYAKYDGNHNPHVGHAKTHQLDPVASIQDGVSDTARAGTERYDRAVAEVDSPICERFARGDAAAGLTAKRALRLLRAAIAQRSPAGGTLQRCTSTARCFATVAPGRPDGVAALREISEEPDGPGAQPAVTPMVNVCADEKQLSAAVVSGTGWLSLAQAIRW